jgi:hypothetical protein
MAVAGANFSKPFFQTGFVPERISNERIASTIWMRQLKTVYNWLYAKKMLSYQNISSMCN